MSRRIVRVAPDILREMMTKGERVGSVAVKEGLPADAKFIRWWYDAACPDDGMFVLLFEHESWPFYGEGSRLPVYTFTTQEIIFERSE